LIEIAIGSRPDLKNVSFRREWPGPGRISITSIIIPLARTRRYRQTSAACRDSPDRPTLSSHDHSRQKGLGQSVVIDQMMRRQQ
jgi:hypothetical protein